MWQQTKLGDVLTLQRGFDLPRKKREEGRYPIVSSSGVTGYHAEFKAEGPGVVTGRYGTLGEVFYIPGPYWPLNTALWVKDFKGNDPRFLFYFLQTLGLARSNVAGAVPGVNRNVLHAMDVQVPPLPTQRRIAAILSAYDDLIENNTKRIKILEEMARALYREWFVHFRFPGHEKVKFVDSPLGQIPEGWKVVPIGDLIAKHIGGGWGKEEPDAKHVIEAPVIRGTDIATARYTDTSGVPVRFHSESNVRSRALEVGDIVMEVSGGGKHFNVGRSFMVQQRLLDEWDGPIICASFCKRIKPNVQLLEPTLISHHIEDQYQMTDFDQYQVQSTGIKNFKFKTFLEHEQLVVPPRDLQHELTPPLRDMGLLVSVLGAQNAGLRQTRDLLLPRLISGDLDVTTLPLPDPP